MTMARWQDGYESIVGKGPSGVAECIAGIVLCKVGGIVGCKVGHHRVLGDVLRCCGVLVVVGELEREGVRHVCVLWG